MYFKLIRSFLFSALLVTISLMLSITKVSAQFNLRIGYSLGVTSANTNNEILSAYNTDLGNLYDEYIGFNDLKLVYGISLGLRYKFGIGALEINWEGLGRSISSTGITNPDPPLQPTAVTEEFNYDLNHLMLTYETNFERLGIGTSIGRNFVSINQLLSNGDNKLPLLKNSPGQYFARFHLTFNFYGSNTVAFAIKPFLQVGLTDVNLSSFATNLKVASSAPNESFPMWGLSFAFYNGRQ